MPRSQIRKNSTTNQLDIARAAKVSTATVSRVLNNSPLVRDEVRARVNRAMDRLGYFPHGAARALALNRSWTIGAVVPTLDSDIFARGINALMNRLRDREYTLIVSSSNYSLEVEGKLIRRLLERGVDGIFLVGAERDPEAQDVLERSGKPFVNAYISGRAACGPTIGFSNRDGGAAIVDHLVELGHSRIGMFAGITSGNDRAAERLAGARARMKRHGLALDPSSTIEMSYTFQAARSAFGELVQACKLPTALICGNDILAMGVLFEAATRGVKIPKQLSLVGFDNHPMTAHFQPSLTTIDVPADQMGEISADALVTAIATGAPIPSVVLKAPLLVRGSTAEPRHEHGPRGRASCVRGSRLILG